VSISSGREDPTRVATDLFILTASVASLMGVAQLFTAGAMAGAQSDITGLAVLRRFGQNPFTLGALTAGAADAVAGTVGGVVVVALAPNDI
jgi:hypothetical protein